MIAELKDCFRALNPNALRQMDIMQERIENCQQKALAEEELTIALAREKQELVNSFTKKLSLALQLLPPMLKLEYEKVIGLADAFPEWAARNADYLIDVVDHLR